jgi:hypothetical protein
VSLVEMLKVFFGIVSDDPDLGYVPEGVVGEGEQVIATVTDTGIQQMLGLARACFDAAENIPGDMSNVQSARLRQVGEVLRSLFWAMVQEKYDLWQRLADPEVEGMHLREGWQLVIITAKPKRRRPMGIGIIDVVMGGGPIIPDELMALFSLGEGDCGNPNCPIHGDKVRERMQREADEAATGGEEDAESVAKAVDNVGAVGETASDDDGTGTPAAEKA